MVYKYIPLFIVIITLNTATGFAQKTDSLKMLLAQSEGTERIDLLHQLILSVWLNYPGQGMRYGHQALDLSIQLNDSVNISKSLRLIAGVHYYKGDFDASLKYNQNALAIAEILQDSTLINNGYNNIGLLYYNLGSYATGLEYLIRSKSMKERMNQTYGLSTTLNNIGLIFMKVSEYIIARNYFFEALDIARKSETEDQIVYSQNNIALTYLRQNNYEAALIYFEKALKLARTVKNINWGAVSLRGIGEIFQNNGQYDSARHYYQNSLNASMTIDDKRGIAEVYYLMAQLEFLESNAINALAYLDKGHLVANQLGDRHQLLANLQLFSEINRSINDKEQEVYYQRKYIKLQDSLFQDVASRNLALIPIKIGEEENRIEIARQRIQIEQNATTNRLYAIIIIIGIVFMVLLLILLKKIRKVNLLQKQTLDEIAFVEAHQLRGPISSLLGLISLLKMKPNNQQDHNLYIDKIKELANKIDTVSKEIIQKSDQDHD